MDLAKPEAAAELDAAGPALEGGAIDLHGPGPVACPLLVEPALEDDDGVIVALGEEDGGGSVVGGSRHAACPADPIAQARKMTAKG